MAFQPTHTGSEMADINMTPLIDVLLVLIVIFMVITPLTPMGLEAQIPQADTARADAPQTPASVVVTVHRAGVIDINRERIAVEDLGPRLVAVFRNSARPTVFVQGDAALEFREVAQVIDIAHGAGIRRIGLMTSPVAE